MTASGDIGVVTTRGKGSSWQSPGRRHEVCSSKYLGAQDSPPVAMNFLVPKANRAIRRSALLMSSLVARGPPCSVALALVVSLHLSVWSFGYYPAPCYRACLGVRGLFLAPVPPGRCCLFSPAQISVTGLALSDLGSSPRIATSWLCDLGPVT